MSVDPSSAHVDAATVERSGALRILLREHRQFAAVLMLLRLALDEFSSGRHAADFKLLALILSYIDRFPDQFHHRKEDLYLLARLREHDAAPALIERCAEEHLTGARLLTGLHRTFVAFQANLPGATSDFLDACAAYVQFHLQHMQWEESELFPLAVRTLSTADWALIHRAFAANQDPLRGGPTASSFEQLRQSIVERLPERQARWFADAPLDVDDGVLAHFGED